MAFVNIAINNLMIPRGHEKNTRNSNMKASAVNVIFCGYIAVTLQGLMKHKSGKHGIKIDVPVEMFLHHQCWNVESFTAFT